MELFVAGKGLVRLEQTDFVGQGGEGRVYARGDIAYKIYTDPARMIPVAKIRELAVLTHSNVIRPEDVLLDGRNREIGYTMRRVQDAHPLCRLFTRAFRERKGMTPGQMLALVREFKDTVQHVHDQGVLIVDMNEMNFLVDRDLQRVLFIDVDSYKTPGFPATAIMDSIRDRHAVDFNVETDWFAFAILTFQMLIGIHPYRGKHPTLTDLDARMQANVSVLNPAVTLPVSCYPLDSLPTPYRDWYEAQFEQGLRTPPPAGVRCVPGVTPKVLHFPAAVRLKIREVSHFQKASFAEDVDGHSVHVLQRSTQTQPGPSPVVLQVVDGSTVLTTEGIFISGVMRLKASDLRKDSPACSADLALTVTPRLRRLVAAAWEQGRVRLWDVLETRELRCSLHAEDLFPYANRLYVKQGMSLYELRWLELPAGLQPLLHPVANVLPHSTRLFDGVAVQEIPGAW